jgi:hypothetical protein
MDADWLNSTAEMQCHISSTKHMQQKRKDTTFSHRNNYAEESSNHGRNERSLQGRQTNSTQESEPEEREMAQYYDI